jgi:hypothetical protein
MNGIWIDQLMSKREDLLLLLPLLPALHGDRILQFLLPTFVPPEVYPFANST